MSDIVTCKDCGANIAQTEEKALSGEVKTVWMDVDGGNWVCDESAQEHVPGEFVLSPEEALHYSLLILKEDEYVDGRPAWAKAAVITLTQVKEWVRAQGEDFQP